MKLNKIQDEGGYASVLNIMRGLVPTINSLAFLTAGNPNGKSADSATNFQANEELGKRLRSMNLGFKKIKGHCGGPDNSFFIPNINKDEALELGKQYNQEYIIFGEKSTDTKDGKSYDGMTFSLIYTDHRYGQTCAQKDVFVNMDNADDYYTKVKGRKFQIPFFDDDFTSAQFAPSSGVISNQGLREMQVTEIQMRSQDALRVGKTGKSRWLNRGALMNLLRDTTL